MIDAYRTDALAPNERGLGSALAVLGYRIAMIVSGGIPLIWASEGFSWPHIYRIMAAILASCSALSLFFTPRLVVFPKTPGDSPWREVVGFIALLIGVCLGAFLARYTLGFIWDPLQAGHWVRFLVVLSQIVFACLFGLTAAWFAGFKTLYSSLNSYFARPNAWAYLALVLFYKIGDAFALSLLTPFLISGVGFDPVQVGLVHKTAGLFMTIAGAMLGGVFLLRMQLSRALFWFGILQAGVILGFYVLAVNGPGLLGSVTLPAFNLLIIHVSAGTAVDRLLLLILSLDNLFNGMGTAALVALISGLCKKQFSATHYALLSAFTSVGRVFLGPIAGVVAEAYGWPCFFIDAIFTSIPGIVIVWFLRKRIDEIS